MKFQGTPYFLLADNSYDLQYLFTKSCDNIALQVLKQHKLSLTRCIFFIITCSDNVATVPAIPYSTWPFLR